MTIEKTETFKSGAEIIIHTLRVTLGRGVNQLVIIDQLTHTVGTGKVVSILGPSGCGKTTLLRVLGGLLHNGSTSTLIEGNITIDGLTVESFSALNCTEVFFQNPVLLPWLNLRSNLALPRRLQRKPATNNQIDDALNTVELAGFSHHHPRQLSGGMKQRAVLARSLLTQPSLMLMDEPFAALDDLAREEMDRVLLSHLHRHSATVLFVTHSVREAAMLGDEIVFLTARPTRVSHFVPGVPRANRLANPDSMDIVHKGRECRDIIRSISGA